MSAINLSLHDPDWYPLQDEFESVPYHSHVVIGSFMVVILLLAVVGNTVVVVVFLGSRKLRTPSNSLIVNLAMADLLMALSGFPLLIVSSFYGRWVYDPWVCDFYGITATMFGLMSINTLVFISLDRYVVIVSPQRMHHVTNWHARCCILVIWAYSFVWGIIPMFGWNRYILEGYGTTCSIDYFTREAPHSHFLLCMLLGDYILPCGLIVYCYAWIFHTVKSHSLSFYPMVSTDKQKSQLGRNNSRASRNSMRNSIRVYASQNETKEGKRKFKWTQTEYKIARTVLVVILFYCMAWTPYALVTLIGQYGNVNNITPTVSMLPAVFAKVSTVYNPIVYSLTHPRFKIQLKKLFNIVLPSSFRINQFSRTSSSRVSGRVPQRTCEISGESHSAASSFTDSPIRKIFHNQEEKQELTVPEEIVPCLDNTGEAQEEVLTPIQELPEMDSSLSNEERQMMKSAMIAGQRKLNQAIFPRHACHLDADRLQDEDITRTTWRDISGESLLSVNIEAIQMERIN